MVTYNGKSQAKRAKRSRLTFFFWNGQLHRVIRINRPANLVDAWHFADHKTVTILYSDFRTKAKRAVRLSQAAEILHISTRHVRRLISEGNAPKPQKSYPLDRKTDKPGINWYGEEDLLQIHDYFMTVHLGRPRKDGVIVPNQNLPTRAEIRAKMNESTTLFIKSEEGEFVPLYEPPKF